MRKPNYKRVAKMFGAVWCMGMGALLMGTVYVNAIEHLTGEPLNK
jgi:hypothetical protein